MSTGHIGSRPPDIRPGARHGTRPPGATEGASARPPVEGADHFLTLGALVGGDALMIHATVRFTR